VPLWKGAGVKLKTLAFLGAGIPVAGTSVAVEGLEVQPGRHCLVAEDARELGRALSELLDDPERARQMGAAARALVSKRYTWDAVAPRFLGVVEEATRS
jgi:glycosyltransferase involved in cell wall biosynthesis